MRPRIRTIAAAALLALCGCPPESTGSKKSSEPVETCTSAGQSCKFAEGKLGLCVARTEPCNGQPCFMCQSQH